MIGSLRLLNIENFISLTFNFVYMLASSIQGKEGCNIPCVVRLRQRPAACFGSISNFTEHMGYSENTELGCLSSLCISRSH